MAIGWIDMWFNKKKIAIFFFNYKMAIITIVLAIIFLALFINYIKIHPKPDLDYNFQKRPIPRSHLSLVIDDSNLKHKGVAYNTRWNSFGGRNGGAIEFNGLNSSIQTYGRKDLSPSTTGKLTIAFWIKFSNTNFRGEGSHKDYINFMGKAGYDDDNEYLFRQYNSSNEENRSDRISFYIFNPEGGLGAGAYFQEPINTSEWVFITGVVREDKIEIWKNGILRGVGDLIEYNITPRYSNVPFNIGTVNEQSYFNGSIERVTVFKSALSKREINYIYEESIVRV